MTINVKINREAKTITWQSDKTTLVVVAKVADMSAELKERAMYHGLNARGTDAGAMGFDHWDGKDKPKRYALDSEKMARIDRVVQHLNNPATGWDWDLRPSADSLASKSPAELEELIKAAQQRLAALGVK